MRVKAIISNSAIGQSPCLVDNLSRLGCRVHLSGTFAVDSYLSLTFPGHGPLGTRVAWCDGLRSGLEFLNPLHVAVLDDLLRLFPAPENDPGDGPQILRDWEPD